MECHFVCNKVNVRLYCAIAQLLNSNTNYSCKIQFILFCVWNALYSENKKQTKDDKRLYLLSKIYSISIFYLCFFNNLVVYSAVSRAINLYSGLTCARAPTVSVRRTVHPTSKTGNSPACIRYRHPISRLGVFLRVLVQK